MIANNRKRGRSDELETPAQTTEEALLTRDHFHLVMGKVFGFASKEYQLALDYLDMHMLAHHGYLYSHLTGQYSPHK